MLKNNWNNSHNDIKIFYFICFTFYFIIWFASSWFLLSLNTKVGLANQIFYWITTIVCLIKISWILLSSLIFAMKWPEKIKFFEIKLIVKSLLFLFFLIYDFVIVMKIFVYLIQSQLSLIENLKLSFLIIDLFLVIFLFLNLNSPIAKSLNYAFKRHKILFGSFISIIAINTIASTLVIFFSSQNTINWTDIFLAIVSGGLVNNIKILEFSSVLLVITVIINSLFFFLFGFLFTQSISFTLKNRHKIFMDFYVRNDANKKIIVKSKLFNTLKNQKFIKEFWDIFSDYWNVMEEKQSKNYWIYTNDQKDFNVFLNEVRKKIGNQKYDKYIRIKDKRKRIIEFNDSSFLLSFRLSKLGFYENFARLYEIKIANLKDENIKEINNLIKKHSVLCHFDDKDTNNDENLVIKSAFSFKWCLNRNSIIENFTNDKILRQYSFKIKNCNKNINEVIDEENTKNLLTLLAKKIDLKESDIDLKPNKYSFKVAYHTTFLENRKKEEIDEVISELNKENKENKWSLKITNFKSFLEYSTNSEQEKEQIWIKINSNNLDCKFKKKKRKKDEDESKKEKKLEEIKPEDTFNNYLKKIIITSDIEGELNQSFKTELFNFFGVNNITDFEEKIYLSKSSSKFAKEKHSFQFILSRSSLNEDQLKNFNNLMSKHSTSYSTYSKHNFFDNAKKKETNLEYTILYLNPLEKWN